MEEKFVAVVYKSADYRDFDKRLLLITPEGARQAVMRGVKRPKARLRFAATPFAFCEFTAVAKNDFLTVTGASQVEDLFGISGDTQKLTAGSVILESAYHALKSDCAPQFVFLLKRLKDIIYSDSHPFAAAVRFLQYIIHKSGYGYQYQKPEGDVDTPLKLLSALSFLEEDKPAPSDLGKDVLHKTLVKIIDNFEKKFEVEILSKKLLCI